MEISDITTTYVTMATDVVMMANVTKETLSCYHDITRTDNITYFVLLLNCIIFSVCFTIIAVIWRTRSLHRNTDIIVASLCTADILFSVSFTFRIMQDILFTYSNTQVRNIIATFLKSNIYSTCVVSITHLGFVAIDRYIRIAHPFYYARRMTKRRNAKIIFVIWIVGLTYLMIPVITFTDTNDPKYCIIAHPPIKYYSVVLAGYSVNILVIFLSYLKIAYLAFQHKKAANIRRLQQVDKHHTTFIQNRMAAMRSVKFFGIMFGVFLLFTAPPVTLGGFKYISNLAYDLITPFSVMLMLNSLANGLIYAFMRREFIKTIAATLTNCKHFLCKL